MAKQVSSTYPLRQAGASALEFALVFPVLFTLLYGMVSYAMLFAAQHSLSQAAADGARAAMRFHSTNDASSQAVRNAEACKVAVQGVRWLEPFGGLGLKPCNSASRACGSASNGAALSCVFVQVSYDYLSKPLLPRLPWLVPVPDTLVGEATVQVALQY